MSEATSVIGWMTLGVGACALFLWAYGRLRHGMDLRPYMVYQPDGAYRRFRLTEWGAKRAARRRRATRIYRQAAMSHLIVAPGWSERRNGYVDPNGYVNPNQRRDV